jgi:serine/threonine protein kinase
MDIWSVGCVFSELLTGTVLFPGQSSSHQHETIIQKLHANCNPGGELSGEKSRICAGHQSEDAIEEFLMECLQYDHNMRSTANKLLQHRLLTRRAHSL